MPDKSAKFGKNFVNSLDVNYRIFYGFCILIFRLNPNYGE